MFGEGNLPQIYAVNLTAVMKFKWNMYLKLSIETHQGFHIKNKVNVFDNDRLISVISITQRKCLLVP